MHSCGQARGSAESRAGTRAAGHRSAHLPGSPARRTAESVPPGGGGARSPRTRSPAGPRGTGHRGRRPSARGWGCRGVRGGSGTPLPLGAPRGSRWLGVYLLPHRLPAFYKYRFAPSRRLCAALRVVPDSTSVVSAPLSLRPSPAFPGQSLPPAWILPLLPLSSI